MRYPKFLIDNKNITLIAPSFGCTTEPYKSRLIKSIEVLKEKGFNPILGPNAFLSIGYRSNTSELCAKEFTDAYNSNSLLLLSVGGGFLENEILDFIDFKSLTNKEPKWFMGYSDNTNLTLTMTLLLDIATIYGANAPDFGTNDLHISQINQLKFLTGEKLKFSGYDKFEIEEKKNEENPYLGYNLDTKKVLTCLPNEINVSGRLLGGCLDCITYLVGTKYDKVKDFCQKYKDDGIIWFLEACDLEAWNYRLALLQLKRAGWFTNVKCFIIGRPYKLNNTFTSLNMHNAVTDILSDLNVPIILDADFGHLKPQIPMICGAYANVKAQNGKNIEIEYILK